MLKFNGNKKLIKHVLQLLHFSCHCAIYRESSSGRTFDRVPAGTETGPRSEIWPDLSG